MNVAKNAGKSLNADAHDLESKYLQLLHFIYERNNPAAARRLAGEVQQILSESDEHEGTVFEQEIRALASEARGELEAAARYRESEIREILELHALSIHTPAWPSVARRYGFADLSDRLDLLAILYDQIGDTKRAVDTLLESKAYCKSHSIRFDAQTLLDELQAELPRAARKAANGRPRKQSLPGHVAARMARVPRTIPRGVGSGGLTSR